MQKDIMKIKVVSGKSNEKFHSLGDKNSFDSAGYNHLFIQMIKNLKEES